MHITQPITHSLPSQAPAPSIVLFSGGTAMNSLAAALSSISPHIAHVLPVSDDGGSTAEIVRVLGGPAVGDIRSRCLRLSDVSTAESRAVKRLLQHRLPMDRAAARAAWQPIVEGSDALWEGIESPYKHTIRAFLIHFNQHILVHASHDFDFAGGSIGNFFFAGARLFLNSLNAAIFLYSRVSGIPQETAVLPITKSVSDQRVVLGACLADGRLVRGQNAISHPDGSKGGGDALPSPITRVCYLSSDVDHGSPAVGAAAEVHPSLNPLVETKLRSAHALVYGCGSLYTSICPSLIVRGVGEEVAALGPHVPRILMLNGSPDRETSGMVASDYVKAITGALNREHELSHEPSTYVTVLFCPKGAVARIPIDHEVLEGMGIRVVEVPSTMDAASGTMLYDSQAVVDALVEVLGQQRPSPLPRRPPPSPPPAVLPHRRRVGTNTHDTRGST